VDFQEIIAAKRDGREHSLSDLEILCKGAADGSIPDYQLAAWLMAAYLHPLNATETADLTRAMAESGERLDLTGLPKPWVDKHSTGGVGDKTSLVLLPLLAACGLTVVKMSGRGLGITGGTVDKLSSVPGFRTDLSPEEMKAQAAKIGLALTGQTPNLAPADKTLYALRDVTATVGSMPLIVSSILSKKVAGGAETIVLDVKCGSGAFMKVREEATKLADGLRSTGKALGLNVRLAMTDMDQPLGSAVGNALEVQEALDVLQGKPLNSCAERFRELCLSLAALTLEASGLCGTHELARAKAEDALASGKAESKRAEWFEAQGATSLDLPKAPQRLVVKAEGSGFVHRVDAEIVGHTVIDLGGGRKQKTDTIDLSVGIEILCLVGDQVEQGQNVATVHAHEEASAQQAAERLLQAVVVKPEPAAPNDLILDLR